MIKELLHTCGLNKTEADVFLFLAKHGSRNAGVISKATRLNRSTVYSALMSLVRQGFVNKSKRGNITSFAPVTPQLLGKVVENSARHRYSEVMLASARLPAEIQTLSKAALQDSEGFEVTVFESVQAVYTHLEETLGKGDFSAMFNPQTACAGEGKRIHAHFLKTTASSRPVIREIIVKGPQADWYRKSIKNPNHKVKQVADSVPLGADIICHKGSVVITNYDASEEFAVRIKSGALYRSMLAIFDLLWASLPENK